MKSARFLAVLALCTLILGCGTKPYSTLPDELVGVWKTSAPQYAGRYFELKRDMIVFGTGGGTASSHVIDRIQEAREGDQTLYTIFYTEDGTKYHWSFYYDPVLGKSIRLKHQASIVWTRKRTS